MGSRTMQIIEGVLNIEAKLVRFWSRSGADRGMCVRPH